MVFTGFGCSQKEEKLIDPLEIDFTWEMDSKEKESFINNLSLAEEKGRMFVYGTEVKIGNGNLERFIGLADYKEGYLYLRDYVNDKLYQLSTVPVESSQVVGKQTYVFAYDNDIFELSDDFKEYKLIYSGTGVINFNVMTYGGPASDKWHNFYFLDGDKLMRYSLDDYSYSMITDKVYADSVVFKDDNYDVMMCTIKADDGEINYIINLRDGYRRAVTNELEYRMFGEVDDFVGQETEYTYQKFVADSPVFGDPKY